jgi:hypothetical protein
VVCRHLDDLISRRSKNLNRVSLLVALGTEDKEHAMSHLDSGIAGIGNAMLDWTCR